MNLLDIFPLPYVSDRSPTPDDRYAFYKDSREKFPLCIGTIWVNKKDNECYMLKSIKNGLCEWVNFPEQTMNDLIFAYLIVTVSVLIGIGAFHLVVWSIKRMK